MGGAGQISGSSKKRRNIDFLNNGFEIHFLIRNIYYTVTQRFNYAYLRGYFGLLMLSCLQKPIRSAIEDLEGGS